MEIIYQIENKVYTKQCLIVDSSLHCILKENLIKAS